MLIGSLIGFGALVVSWLVLPSKEKATEAHEARPSVMVDLLPGEAQ